jgi:hypothetical protein
MRSSRIRTVLVVVAVGAFVGCGSVSIGLLTAEPRLEGRTVRSWLRKYEAECCFSSGNEAWGVFHRSGTNALPGLISIFDEKPPGLAHAIVSRRRNGRYVPYCLESWASQKEMLWGSDRYWAMLLCADLGVEARAVHALLIAACRDSDTSVRRDAARLLSNVEVPPEVAVPVLSQLMLHDGTYEVRSMAAYSLGQLGPNAEAAIPALRQATNDSYEGTRDWARKALERVENASTETKERSHVTPYGSPPKG